MIVEACPPTDTGSGYSKTFPRDFLTFLDSFSSYNLAHNAASVGNKDNSTPRVPYSRLTYINIWIYVRDLALF